MIEQYLDKIVIAGGGAVTGYIIKELWNYVTKKNCTECKMIDDMKKELVTVKKILLEVAEKSGVNVDRFRELVK